jgi:hypothetical protein
MPKTLSKTHVNNTIIVAGVCESDYETVSTATEDDTLLLPILNLNFRHLPMYRYNKGMRQTQ